MAISLRRFAIAFLGVTGSLPAIVLYLASGLSVLAQGLLDRLRGAQDLCKATLDEATASR